MKCPAAISRVRPGKIPSNGRGAPPFYSRRAARPIAGLAAGVPRHGHAARSPCRLTIVPARIYFTGEYTRVRWEERAMVLPAIVNRVRPMEPDP